MVDDTKIDVSYRKMDLRTCTGSPGSGQDLMVTLRAC